MVVHEDETMHSNPEGMTAKIEVFGENLPQESEW